MDRKILQIYYGCTGLCLRTCEGFTDGFVKELTNDRVALWCDGSDTVWAVVNLANVSYRHAGGSAATPLIQKAQFVMGVLMKVVRILVFCWRFW